MEAIDTLYSDDVVSVEAMDSEEMPAEIRGIAQIRGKNQWWFENNEVHEATAQGPYPHNDKFAVKYSYDITAKAGPNKGNRMKFDEVAIYTTANGKITREEFFYET